MNRFSKARTLIFFLDGCNVMARLECDGPRSPWETAFIQIAKAMNKVVNRYNEAVGYPAAGFKTYVRFEWPGRAKYSGDEDDEADEDGEDDKGEDDEPSDDQEIETAVIVVKIGPEGCVGQGDFMLFDADFFNEAITSYEIEMEAERSRESDEFEKTVQSTRARLRDVEQQVNAFQDSIQMYLNGAQEETERMSRTLEERIGELQRSLPAFFGGRSPVKVQHAGGRTRMDFRMGNRMRLTEEGHRFAGQRR